jgi:hypothetical protein
MNSDGTPNLEAEQAMIRRQELQSRLVAEIVARLDAIPDADGTTLLDNTIVLYVNEAASGGHNFEYDPFIVFGGGATGRIRPGRYLKYRQDMPNPWQRNSHNQETGTSHARLFVALLQAMGLPDDHIFFESLTGRSERSGSVVLDQSGPLERVG